MSDPTPAPSFAQSLQAHLDARWCHGTCREFIALGLIVLFVSFALWMDFAWLRDLARVLSIGVLAVYLAVKLDQYFVAPYARPLDLLLANNTKAFAAATLRRALIILGFLILAGTRV